MTLFYLDNQVVDDWILSENHRLKLGFKYSDVQIFNFAQWLGFKSIGQTSPNPMVSAILCDSENKIVAYGYHELFGGKHAEVNCIESFFKEHSNLHSLEAFKMFVSLEPCFHFGKTPPCVDLLLKYKLGEICIAAKDPNPLVAGKSIEKLKLHNVNVKLDQRFFDSTKLLNFIFLKSQILKRPVVAVKFATSSNQFYARKDGRPYAFTGERSRAFAHFLRIWFDAMLLGVQTILEDRPILDTRSSRIDGRNPAIVVVDPSLRFLDADWDQHPWLKIDRKQILFLVSESVSELRKNHFRQKLHKFSDRLGKICEVYVVPSRNNVFSAQDILEAVSLFGYQSILVEGGMKVASSFYEANLVDMLFHFESSKSVSAEDFEEWILPKSLAGGMAKSMEFLALGEDKIYIEFRDE